MAPSTKAKIRNLMSVLFNRAIRYEWLEQGRNPILLVRQSAKRQPSALGKSDPVAPGQSDHHGERHVDQELE
jgi:hypothetical protein